MDRTWADRGLYWQQNREQVRRRDPDGYRTRHPRSACGRMAFQRVRTFRRDGPEPLQLAGGGGRCGIAAGGVSHDSAHRLRTARGLALANGLNGNPRYMELPRAAGHAARIFDWAVAVCLRFF